MNSYFPYQKKNYSSSKITQSLSAVIRSSGFMLQYKKILAQLNK